MFVGHEPSVLKYEIPQGSLLGSLLFTLYTSTVICQSGLSYHSPLHNSSVSLDFPAPARRSNDVAEWVSDSKWPLVPG